MQFWRGHYIHININYTKIEYKYLEKILIDYFDFFLQYKHKNGIVTEPMHLSMNETINIFFSILTDPEYIDFLKKTIKNTNNKRLKNILKHILSKAQENKRKSNSYYKQILDNYKNEKDRFFDYERLRDDLILIAKQILKNLNSVEFEKENAINDKFISGLELQKYNVAGENRVNNANERDIIIKDENQSEKAIIEALRITSIQKDYIKEHYDKLIDRYDVMGHSVGYLLIYVKNQNFEKRWKGYKAYLSEFSTFEDTNISDVSNIKVGKNQIDDKIIYHIFINFYNKNENKGIK